MKNQLNVIANVKGLGRIVETNSDLYTELQQLKDSGAVLISPRDEAYTRLYTRGKENIGKSYGTRTSGGFECIKEKLPIFRVKSRLTNLKFAKLAVEANRAGNYFHTDSTKEYEESLKQAEQDKNKEPVERNIIVLPSRSKFTISDTQNWEIYQAILKDQAKPYFELNGHIDVYPLDEKIVNAQYGTILTHLWFRCLGGRSDFDGGSRSLSRGCRARGVCKSAEGTSPKILGRLPYTQRQIKKYSRIIQGVRAGTLPASKLEKVAEFLQDLKQ